MTNTATNTHPVIFLNPHTSPDAFTHCVSQLTHKKNILIIGPTDSGKTTLLSQLAAEIDDNLLTLDDIRSDNPDAFLSQILLPIQNRIGFIGTLAGHIPTYYPHTLDFSLSNPLMFFPAIDTLITTKRDAHTGFRHVQQIVTKQDHTFLAWNWHPTAQSLQH